MTISFETRLAAAAPADDDLSWLPAWRIRQLIETRALSPVDVVDHFLMRIDTLDPQLHAFRTIDRDGARAQAKAAETAVMRGEPLGALHGIPVATKSVLSIKGNAATGFGAAQGIAPDHDAMEIERLRKAGAIIVGPTVSGLTAREFGSSDRAPLNPWDTERACGDSSGGSACAAAAAMVPIAIGGDGMGSTRLPAAFCGLVGVHPTRGLVPSFEWVTLNTRPFTTYGPMTRDVRDAATVLSVLAGPDGREMMSLQSDPPDFLAGLDAGVTGMRLGWTDDYGYARKYAVEETPRVIETVRTAAWRLSNAGARIEAIEGMLFEEPIWAANQWIATDVAQTTDYDLGLTLPSREEIARAREVRGRVWQAMRDVTDRYDLLLCPTVLEVAPTRKQWAIDGISTDFFGIYPAMAGVANFIGWPAISVPAGLVDGLPVALQIIGRPHDEPRMFRLAQAFLAAQPS